MIERVQAGLVPLEIEEEEEPVEEGTEPAKAPDESPEESRDDAPPTPPENFRLRVHVAAEPGMEVLPSVLCAPSFLNRAQMEVRISRAFRDLQLSGYPLERAVVDVFVDQRGRPGEVKMTESSGIPQVDGRIQDIVNFARWDPATIDGVARGVWVRFPVTPRFRDED